MALVRAAGPGDAARVALIAQAAFLETFAGLLAGDDIVAHCAGELSTSAHEAWLADAAARIWLAQAEQGGAPIGYALLARPALPVPVGATDLELKRIYLLSRYHGGGAGRALMEAAVASAVSQGAARLLLGVYAGNERAIAFYQKHGFAKVGERQFQVGGTRYEDIVLARNLETER